MVSGKIICMPDSVPGRTAVLLRPVGYLLVALVWTALSMVSVALSASLTLGLAASGWHPQDLFQDVNIVVFLFELAIIALIWAALVGMVLIILPLASVPLAMLSWTYVVRALRPSFAHEKLSRTSQSRNSIGPATVTGTVAMSLQPVRPSRWTDFWMRLYSVGWSPNGRIWLAGLPWGVATFVMPGWVLWPVNPVAFAIWTLLTLGALAWSARFVRQAIRPTRRGNRTDRRRLQRSLP